MVIGNYIDLNCILTDFNFDIHLNVFKKFVAFSTNCKTFIYDLEHNLEKIPYTEIPCIGIPILGRLDSSNSSLIIEHHFTNVQGQNRIQSYIFSYRLNDKHYVNLPNFTFYILIISDILKVSGKSSFKGDGSDKFTIFTNPKYFSLHSIEEDNCDPIFLKQRSDKIKIKYINVDNCNLPECICKKVLENALKYAFFDPKN